ncbi:hypothetical protein [Nonomuraea sp. NPDC050643]|uniref:hypothetical protein n=1 Tax=Nonomuraea sp. NPDC050643 TaxID=3155660 RepID=UPI0033F54F21
MTRRLMAALATATLAGSVVAALPAAALAATMNTATTTTATTVQRGVLFDGFGKGLDEDTALANAEAAARRNAADHGFTACDVFESVVSQDPRSLVFFAVVAVRCEDVSA